MAPKNKILEQKLNLRKELQDARENFLFTPNAPTSSVLHSSLRQNLRTITSQKKQLATGLILVSALAGFLFTRGFRKKRAKVETVSTQKSFIKPLIQKAALSFLSKMILSKIRF